MKIKKRFLKRLIFVIMLTIVLMNYCTILLGGNEVHASEGLLDSILGSELFDKLGALLNGIVAILGLIPRISLLLIGFLIKVIMSACVSLGGRKVEIVTIEHIFFSGTNIEGFNGIDFINVNFFDTSGASPLASFRTAIAQWYYILRLISITILLVILIYIGIRMAISTIASEQARYKHMLVDWATSIALLFLLHFIILFIISINGALVNSLGGLLKGQEYEGMTVGEYLNKQIVIDIWTDGIGGIVAAILYVWMQGQAFAFLIFYLKRMITVGFLIIIAPLITITYAIDKIGDGKAQALNAWLKEISYNILIQPFHCVIYLSFFGAVSNILDDSSYGNSLAAYIIAMVILKFIKQAEEILRKIFHFEAQSMSQLGAPAAAVVASTGQLVGVGMKAGQAYSNFRAAGGMKGVKNSIGNTVNNIRARGDVRKSYDSSQHNGMSFSNYKKTEDYSKEVKEKKTAREINSKKNQKRENKARKIYEKNRKEGDPTYDEMIKDKAVENKMRKHFEERKAKGKGKYSYDDLKEMANEKDENGNETTRAKHAKSLLKDAKSNAKRDLTKEDINDTKQKENSKILSNTKPQKAIKGINNGWHKFTQSDGGKLIGAFASDTMKVAAAISAGAFAYGASDNVGTAVSFGQLGYGIAYGALEGTTKTAIADTSDLIKQYAHNNGYSPEEIRNKINDLVNECHSMDFAGMFKKIHDDQVKAQQELSKIVGNKATEMISEMVRKTKMGDEYDIDELIRNNTQGLNLDDDKKEDIEEILKNYSDLLIKSQIAAQYNVVKSSSNMDIDSFGRNVTNNYQKIQNNSTNYIYNYENNRYENIFNSQSSTENKKE